MSIGRKLASALLEDAAGMLLEKGVQLLDSLGQKLPARVRVRSWREQLDDFEGRASQAQAVDDWERQRKGKP